MTRPSQRNLGGKKNKIGKARQGLGIFQLHLSGGNVVAELQLPNHNNSSGVLQDTCRQGQSHMLDTAERVNMCPGISIGNHRK